MAPIIFVWIGQFSPGYLIKSLLFAREQNKNREILIILNEGLNPSLRRVLEVRKIKIHLLENAEGDMELKMNPEGMLFGGDFWINTSLRFFYLEYFCGLLKIDKFFHAELDNAIFNIDGLDERLDQFGNGLFVPQDASDRAIASLIYCNRLESLTELTGLYSKKPSPKHDMAALAMYSREYSEYFFSLPTESYEKNGLSWRILEPSILGGLFDAAAIGQYMLGVDPVHSRGKPSYNCFVNENSNLNWDHVVFDTNGKDLFLSPSGQTTDNYRLFNLHIHAKNWNAFESLLKNGQILKRLKRGKRSIISGRLLIFFGWIIILFLFLKNLIRKLLR
jgi:hypothetical protein